MTAAERAREINATEAEEGVLVFKLAEEQSHWDEYGITTGEELDTYLAWCDYSDTYKEAHGFRDRAHTWRDGTADHWMDETAALYRMMQRDAELDAAYQELCEAQARKAKGPVGPLTWSPFAVLADLHMGR